MGRVDRPGPGDREGDPRIENSSRAVSFAGLPGCVRRCGGRRATQHRLSAPADFGGIIVSAVAGALLSSYRPDTLGDAGAATLAGGAAVQGRPAFKPAREDDVIGARRDPGPRASRR